MVLTWSYYILKLSTQGLVLSKNKKNQHARSLGLILNLVDVKLTKNSPVLDLVF